MVLSEIEAITEKHQQLCADLNLDKESAKASWNSYLQTKHNYTLEGDQRHWLACAIYVACRKSSVPTVGRLNTLIEGNLVSLTRILRLCELTLLQFIDKCRKWANMVHLTNDFKAKVNGLERKFAVSTVVFKKFRLIFDDMFESQEQDKQKTYKKRGLTCTNSLREFLWTLYLVVKSDFADIGDDLVSSYHLLLACCDLIYANAICSDRRDILNRKFVGIPQHFFDDDYDPPTEPICIIDELCKIHEGISIDAKSVREYSFKSQIKKLFERDIFKGESTHFLEILDGNHFDANFRAINKAYEQYVLSAGDFDERVMLRERSVECNYSNQSSSASKNDMGDTESMDDVDPPLVTLTPLTGRQYLKNRDGTNVRGMPPKCEVGRLISMLKTPRTPLYETLKKNGLNDSVIIDIENEIKSKVADFCRLITHNDENLTEQSVLSEKLFYKMLDDIVESEIKMIKLEIEKILKNDLFLRGLFACTIEIVIFSYGCTQPKFPWVLNTLKLSAYDFCKVIELVVRTEMQLTREMVKHLNMLEEKILDSLSWTSDSVLWEQIRASKMPVPACEDVSLPHQLISFQGSIEQNEALNTYASRVRKSDGNGKTRPKRGGSLGLYFRKFYHLASVRIQDLCSQLDISDKAMQMKIWTCFEYVVTSAIDLMKDRHLDQILMCTVYVACKVLEIDLTFQSIMKCYRNQPQAASHVYRNVLLAPTVGENEENVPVERGDLIKFYNSVFVKNTQSFVLKFSAKSSNKGEPLTLSPLPVPKPKTNSPFRRVSEKLQIYVRCLESTDNIAPSPIKPMSYYVNQSPAKDLHAINNMIAFNSAKRSLTALEDEGPSIKRISLRNDSSKLQDMIEDRRRYQS